MKELWGAGGEEGWGERGEEERGEGEVWDGAVVGWKGERQSRGKLRRRRERKKRGRRARRGEERYIQKRRETDGCEGDAGKVLPSRRGSLMFMVASDGPEEENVEDLLLEQGWKE